MSRFTSQLASSIEAFLEYREALGYSTKHFVAILANLDRFLVSQYTDSATLTKEIVISWLDSQHGNLNHKTSCVRHFAEHLISAGSEAYVLPRKFTGSPTHRSTPPYMFSDDELRRLFAAIDSFPENRYEPFLTQILPVMFRLNYACGLRPNESRDLETENVNLDTGEVFITNTKRKKERLVVMSPDMLAQCKEYDSKRAIFARNSRYFFPSWSGDAFAGPYLHRRFTESWIRANKTVDRELLPSVRVYNLRHCFATAALVRWLENGADLKAKLPYLRAYMGHETFDETLYYVHLLPENFVMSSGVNWSELETMVPEVVKW